MKQETWLEVGKEYTDTDTGRARIKNAIESACWLNLADKPSLPFMAGAGIKEAIKSLRIPRVHHVCVTGALVGMDEGRENYLGLYGIRGEYTNGQAEIFLVDEGIGLVPVLSVLYPNAVEVN